LSELEPRKRQHENDEGFPFVRIALGLAFMFGTVAFAFLSPPATLIPAFALSIAAAALLGSALNDIAKRRRLALSPPANKERELLAAIRDSGGNITPAEAAMGTTLTVEEADRMLSELASRGHLRVGSDEGTLFYFFPERRAPELGGRDPTDGQEPSEV
jgi:hypothetical protein